MSRNWLIASLCVVLWMVGMGSVAAEENDMSMSGDMNMSVAMHQQVKSDMKLELLHL